MRPSASSFVGFSLLAVSLWACGGSQPAASGPEGSGPAAGAAQAAEGNTEAPEAWSDTLSDKQKAVFMKEKVVPRMSKVFQAYDAKEYENFDCKTCHGPQMKEPHEFLPALTMKGGKFTAAEKEPEVVKFMMEKVMPEMASLFGKEVYDPATKQGFGCAGCHDMKME